MTFIACVCAKHSAGSISFKQRGGRALHPTGRRRLPGVKSQLLLSLAEQPGAREILTLVPPSLRVNICKLLGTVLAQRKTSISISCYSYYNAMQKVVLAILLCISHEELNLRDINSHVRYYAKLESKLLSVGLQSPGTEPGSHTVGLPRQNQNGDPVNVGTSQISTYVWAKSIVQAPISDASPSQIWTWTPQMFLTFHLLHEGTTASIILWFED